MIRRPVSVAGLMFAGSLVFAEVGCGAGDGDHDFPADTPGEEATAINDPAGMICCAAADDAHTAFCGLTDGNGSCCGTAHCTTGNDKTGSCHVCHLVDQGKTAAPTSPIPTATGGNLHISKP